MKHLIALLGITACLVAPLSAQNTPGDTRVGAKPLKSAAKAPAAVRSHARCVYYITSVPATGSHIPVVIRRYRGEDSALFNSSPGSAYSTGDIGLTGSLSVGGALTALDPAISSAGSGSSIAR